MSKQQNQPKNYAKKVAQKIKLLNNNEKNVQPDILSYLVDRHNVGAGGIASLALLWFPLTSEEFFEHQVHPGVGNHVDVGDHGVLGLTSRLGQVPQQVLRVGQGRPPISELLALK